jgi:hypothetical protein
VFDYSTILSNINEKGGLVSAIDGQCLDQTYVIKGRVADTSQAPDDTGSCTIVAAGDVSIVTTVANTNGCCGKSTDATFPASLC